MQRLAAKQGTTIMDGSSRNGRQWQGVLENAFYPFGQPLCLRNSQPKEFTQNAQIRSMQGEFLADKRHSRPSESTLDGPIDNQGSRNWWSSRTSPASAQPLARVCHRHLPPSLYHPLPLSLRRHQRKCNPPPERLGFCHLLLTLYVYTRSLLRS